MGHRNTLVQFTWTLFNLFLRYRLRRWNVASPISSYAFSRHIAREACCQRSILPERHAAREACCQRDQNLLQCCHRCYPGFPAVSNPVYLNVIEVLQHESSAYSGHRYDICSIFSKLTEESQESYTGLCFGNNWIKKTIRAKVKLSEMRLDGRSLVLKLDHLYFKWCNIYT